VPDFDKYNKKMKQEYEVAFKKVSNDLMNKKYDDWSIGWYICGNIKECYIYKTRSGNIGNDRRIQIEFDTEGCPNLNKLDEWRQLEDADGEEMVAPVSKLRAEYIYKNIRKLTDTPYNNLLKLLQPIWVDEKIPLLKKHEEVKKAFNRFLHGEETAMPEIKESAEVIEKRTEDKQTKKKSGKLSTEQEKELQLIYASGVRNEIAKAKKIIISMS
jgi:hypothetical protein|tara:strand:+ start:549 stop:1190 length:642 start_codon:yes stop_codon:yes gene_type:complete